MDLQWLHNYLIITLGIPFIAEHILGIVISCNALAREFFNKKMMEIVKNNQCFLYQTYRGEDAFFKYEEDIKKLKYCDDHDFSNPEDCEVLLFDVVVPLYIRVCDRNNWIRYQSHIEDETNYLFINEVETDALSFCTAVKDLVMNWKRK